MFTFTLGAGKWSDTGLQEDWSPSRRSLLLYFMFSTHAEWVLQSDMLIVTIKATCTRMPIFDLTFRNLTGAEEQLFEALPARLLSQVRRVHHMAPGDMGSGRRPMLRLEPESGPAAIDGRRTRNHAAAGAPESAGKGSARKTRDRTRAAQVKRKSKASRIRAS